MDFGWKKKADLLKMVVLSAGHQLATELPPGFAKMLAVFERVARTGDGRGMQEEMEQLRRDYSDEPKPLWEPTEIYGWKIQATLYRRNAQLWWLVHAVRKNETTPLDKHVAVLDKVLDHLGAEPTRHAILGPRRSPPDKPPLPFGWWTWENRHPLYTVQVNREKKRDQDKIRIVPLGSRETDGYVSVLGQPDTLRQQVASLTAENAALRREIDEARARKAEREFQIATVEQRDAEAAQPNPARPEDTE